MVTEYNKAYWQSVKQDPEKLARYRARRNKNQNARRAKDRKQDALATLIYGKLAELPQHPAESPPCSNTSPNP